MEDSRTRHKKSRSISWFAVAMAGILGYGLWIAGNGFATISALNTDKDQAQQRLETARTENQQLQQEAAWLSDNEYVEKLAREELGMTRKGEMPYIYAENK